MTAHVQHRQKTCCLDPIALMTTAVAKSHLDAVSALHFILQKSYGEHSPARWLYFVGFNLKLGPLHWKKLKLSGRKSIAIHHLLQKKVIYVPSCVCYQGPGSFCLHKRCRHEGAKWDIFGSVKLYIVDWSACKSLFVNSNTCYTEVSWFLFISCVISERVASSKKLSRILVTFILNQEKGDKTMGHKASVELSTLLSCPNGSNDTSGDKWKLTIYFRTSLCSGEEIYPGRLRRFHWVEGPSKSMKVFNITQR